MEITSQKSVTFDVPATVTTKWLPDAPDFSPFVEDKGKGKEEQISGNIQQDKMGDKPFWTSGVTIPSSEAGFSTSTSWDSDSDDDSDNEPTTSTFSVGSLADLIENSASSGGSGGITFDMSQIASSYFGEDKGKKGAGAPSSSTSSWDTAPASNWSASPAPSWDTAPASNWSASPAPSWDTAPASKPSPTSNWSATPGPSQSTSSSWNVPAPAPSQTTSNWFTAPSPAPAPSWDTPSTPSFNMPVAQAPSIQQSGFSFNTFGYQPQQQYQIPHSGSMRIDFNASRPVDTAYTASGINYDTVIMMFINAVRNGDSQTAMTVAAELYRFAQYGNPNSDKVPTRFLTTMAATACETISSANLHLANTVLIATSNWRMAYSTTTTRGKNARPKIYDMKNLPQVLFLADQMAKSKKSDLVSKLQELVTKVEGQDVIRRNLGISTDFDRNFENQNNPLFGRAIQELAAVYAGNNRELSRLATAILACFIADDPVIRMKGVLFVELYMRVSEKWKNPEIMNRTVPMFMVFYLIGLAMYIRGSSRGSGMSKDQYLGLIDAIFYCYNASLVGDKPPVLYYMILLALMGVYKFDTINLNEAVQYNDVAKNYLMMKYQPLMNPEQQSQQPQFSIGQYSLTSSSKKKTTKKSAYSISPNLSNVSDTNADYKLTNTVSVLSLYQQVFSSSNLTFMGPSSFNIPQPSFGPSTSSWTPEPSAPWAPSPSGPSSWAPSPSGPSSWTPEPSAPWAPSPSAPWAPSPSAPWAPSPSTPSGSSFLPTSATEF